MSSEEGRQGIRLSGFIEGTPRKRQKTAINSPKKVVKRSKSVESEDHLVAVDDEWPDWPAPRTAMDKAREFILEM